MSGWNRGELDKIIERSTQETGAAAPGRGQAPERTYRDEDYHQQGKHRKKSLLQELFDF